MEEWRNEWRNEKDVQEADIEEEESRITYTIHHPIKEALKFMLINNAYYTIILADTNQVTCHYIMCTRNSNYLPCVSWRVQNFNEWMNAKGEQETDTQEEESLITYLPSTIQRGTGMYAN